MAVAKNRVFHLKEYEFDKIIKVPADTLSIAPGHAKLREGAVLDLSECRDLKVINLVGADLRKIDKIIFPNRMGVVNCMGTAFPENFVMDLTKAYRLAKINVYYSKNLKEIIISDRVSPNAFFEMMQTFPDNCDVVVRRANGEVGTKNKKSNEYVGAEEKALSTYKWYSRMNDKNKDM